MGKTRDTGNLVSLDNVYSDIQSGIGSVGIGTTVPTQDLDVDGNIRVRGSLYDGNNESGTSGQILSSTGTGVDWVDGSNVEVIEISENPDDIYYITASDTNTGVSTASFIDTGIRISGVGSILLSSNAELISDSNIQANTVALTNSDGGGDSNITFNHKNTIPSNVGSSARISASTVDTASSLNFGLADNVVTGFPVEVTNVLGLTTNYATVNLNSSDDVRFRARNYKGNPYDAIPANTQDYETIYWDTDKSAIRLDKFNTSQIGLVFPAFRVNLNAEEKHKLAIQYKVDSNSSTGLYVAISEYESEPLPSNKTHISLGPFGGGTNLPEIQVGDNVIFILGTAVDNGAGANSNWTTYEYEYTPGSNAKWAGITIIKGSGLNNNSLYIRNYKREISLELVSASGKLLPDADENLFAGTDAGGGYDASANTACFNNIFGYQAAGSGNLSTGDDNNFLGRYAGYNNTTGGANNFFGLYAGGSNINGNRNNFFGAYAGYDNIGGNDNNFIGFFAGANNETGNYNNFFGTAAASKFTSGDDNNFFGRNAASNQTSGDNNIAIGKDVQLPNTTGSDQLIIGSGSNSWIVGNSFFNVGIGTVNPLTRVHVSTTDPGVEGNANIAIQNLGDGVGTTAALYLAPNTGGGSDLTRAASIKSVQSTIGNYADLRFTVANGDVPTEAMRIGSTGELTLKKSDGVTNFAINGTTTGYGIYLTGIDNSSSRTSLVGMFNDYTISDSGVTGAYGFISDFTIPASYSLNTLRNYEARGSTYGAGASVTSSTGFHVSSNLAQGAANTFGFRGRLANASSVWNLYIDGTADNYIRGNLGIGVTDPQKRLEVARSAANAFVHPELPSDSAAIFTSGTNNAANGCSISIMSGSTGQARVTFGDNSDSSIGQLAYDHSDNSMRFVVNASEQMKIESNGSFLFKDGNGGNSHIGYLGFGQSSPNQQVYLTYGTGPNAAVYFRTYDGAGGGGYSTKVTIDSAGAITATNGIEITGSPGTIAGSNFGNGYLRIGTSSQGWSFDDNEMIAFGDCIINGATGSKLEFTNRPEFNGGDGSLSPFTVDSSVKVTNLNADLLDGISSASFLRSDVDDTYAGTLTGEGNISFSGSNIEIGNGSGSVSMTINDGYGNANLCFNHGFGVPDVNGNALRIKTNVDSTTGAAFFFEGKSNVTANTPTSLNNLFTMGEGGATCLGNTVWHAGNDGPNSGLNADLLDGVEGASFLRSDEADTVTERTTWSLSATNQIILNKPQTNNYSGLTFSEVGDSRFLFYLSNQENGNLFLQKRRNGTSIATVFSVNNGTGIFDFNGGTNFAQNPTVSGNKIWHAGNDGSNSGLDADLLDGVDGSNYLRSNTSDTMSGVLTLNTSTDQKLVLQGSNDPLIRFRQVTTNRAYIQFNNAANSLRLANQQADPDSWLEINTSEYSFRRGNSTTRYFIFGADGYKCLQGINGSSYGNVFNIWWTGSAAQLYIDTTSWGWQSVPSDYRIKKNITNLTENNVLDRIKLLRPVEYSHANYQIFEDSDEVKIGFIAHEVQEQFPKAVENEKDDPDSMQAIKIDCMMTYMIKAMQEQQNIIEELQNKVMELESKMDSYHPPL